MFHKHTIPPDFIALIYLQLAEQIVSDEEIDECSYCRQIFTNSGRKKKYCSLECKTAAGNERRWKRIKEDPEKLEEHRRKSRESMRATRDP